MAMTNAERAAKWRATHPEKALEVSRRYEAENREKRSSRPRDKAVDHAYKTRCWGEFRAWIGELKLDSGCVDCGYAEHPAALDYDHLPGFVKKYNISRMVSYAREKVLAEIAKCEVVCSNCHRVRTAERGASGGTTA